MAERIPGKERPAPPAPDTAAPRVSSNGLGPEAVLRLQRLGGNRATLAMLQRKGSDATPKNDTGLPDTLRTGVEALSGISLDDVQVHHNSPKPAEIGALAYAQGTDIHLGPGQERHLPHEAWHVVQQKQGRVKPTGPGLPPEPAAQAEEADRMGARAEQEGARLQR